MRLSHWLLLFFILSNLSFAQETIPFRLTKHNNIILKTVVNEKDSLDLMFQISMNDAAISPNRKNSVSSIEFQNEISRNNSIQIGNLKRENILFYDNEYSGHESDGKIGKSIFQNQLFAIDYDNSQFIIYQTLPDLEDYIELPLFVDQKFFFVLADNVFEDQQNEMYFLLQSGFSGAIMYSNDMAEKHQLAKILTITNEQEFQDSHGNKATSKQGILPYLKFNHIVFKNLPIGFFEGNARVQSYNYFGADLMKRFNWIFDVENEKVYIKSSKYMEDQYYVVE